MLADKTYSPGRACPLAQVPHWDQETDVVVVGFGAAGACAAIEACEAGAEVVVLEVAGVGGGSASLSGGEVYVGGNGGTDVQREHGFEDATEDFQQYLMLAGGPAADAERVALYADSGVAHFNWLRDQGVPFKGTYLPGKWIEPPTDDTLLWSGNEKAWPYVEQARPAPRGHTVQFVGWGGGQVLMGILCARAEALGAQVRYDSRALALVVDEQQRVVGIVTRESGSPRFIRARRGVILCAGGFIGNRAMVQRFVPAALDCELQVSAGNDDGSGIRMGMSVGAATLNMQEFFATLPFFPPASLVQGIFVNERGQRFVNEDCYHGRVAHHVLRQPNGRAWLLVDNETFGRPVIQPDIPVAAVGESWEEVEQELGLPAGALVHTVEEFNRLAGEGRDPYFHKTAEWLRPLTEPPFAALSYCQGDFQAHAFTLGGLATRPSGEVLDADGQPIAGLYAAGRTACGLPRWGEGYASGLSLGDSTFFGRLAGRHAASAN
ncbi:fumarate reductase/succinate dehydrogenase flavoprotein domain-containing protein [Pseudomonas saudimassiliensis]|uniref:Fumarate reductase/succinate dehydrogenase flavoprotein domain-containing protein n=1 Tax=Pseudomonas saudimassiliensis TaxID=1461581 RepID=A0A078M8Y8_9PSED|nr:FAD-dependent oxidoreductase [Pseudomonas saudimassiliensis]CEA02694.1 fumarate reductase/succinate dehydrogenase flavoprotein domain-containing protein [Pseudomonas saudimassiliensis]CEF25916.1 fumarate reductase/succinate dehydrogenase flavoprotein domain-containing protein [Pseudomonas saudimassiliensis]